MIRYKESIQNNRVRIRYPVYLIRGRAEIGSWNNDQLQKPVLTLLHLLEYGLEVDFLVGDATFFPNVSSVGINGFGGKI
jgi:hypothetical protein